MTEIGLLKSHSGRYRLRHVLLLIARCLAYPKKRLFLRRLRNTYWTNYLNLSLAFRAEKEDRALHWLALRAVWFYLRNGIYYLAPGLWQGFRVEGEDVLRQVVREGNGFLIAGQHLGPQRYLLLELAKLGKPVYVAITEKFVAILLAWRERVSRDLAAQDAEYILGVEPLAVEEATSALKMMRALKRGSIIGVDVDGNIGVGREERTRQETMTVSFLGRDIHVRKGVAYLSYRAQVPIIPVITLWSRQGAIVRFHDPLRPQPGEKIEDYAYRALSKLYGLLESSLHQHPEQWEMWPQFCDWLTPSGASGEDGEDDVCAEAESLRATLHAAPHARLHVRPEAAFVLRIRGRHILVDSNHFRFFLVSKRMGVLLARLYRGIPASHLASASCVLEDLARLRKINVLELGTNA